MSKGGRGGSEIICKTQEGVQGVTRVPKASLLGELMLESLKEKKNKYT